MRHNHKNTTLRDVQWSKSDFIGEGRFGDVYRGHIPERVGRHGVRPHMNVAVKILKNEPKTPEEQSAFLREVETSKMFTHPSLTSFVCCRMFNPYTIVTELAKTDLQKVLNDCGNGLNPSWEKSDGTIVEWNETKKSIVGAGVAIGLCCIHSKNVIHRDLKTENIMLDEDMYPKISDFGLSRVMPYGQEEADKLAEMTMNKGTPLYMAPEMFDESFGGYNQKIDVYAYAMFLYELATGAKPFKLKGEGQAVIFRLQQYITGGQRPIIPSYVNDTWREIMEKCWDPNPEQRPTMKEVVEMITEDTSAFMLDGCDVDEFEDYISMALDALDK